MVDGGYTPSQIDQFTLADVGLFFKRPSVRAMLAGFLGVKDDKPKPAKMSSFAEIRAQFPDGIMRG